MQCRILGSFLLGCVVLIFLAPPAAAACNCSGFLCEAQCSPSDLRTDTETADFQEGIIKASSERGRSYRYDRDYRNDRRRTYHRRHYRRNRHREDDSRPHNPRPAAAIPGVSTGGSDTGGNKPGGDTGVIDACFSNIEGDRVCPGDDDNANETPEVPETPVASPGTGTGSAPQPANPKPPRVFPTPETPSVPDVTPVAETPPYEWPPGLSPSEMTIGVSWHPAKGEDLNTFVSALNTYGLSHVRFDVGTDEGFKPDARTLASAQILKDNGIPTTAILYTDLAWQVKADGECPGDSANLEQAAYEQTAPQVKGLKDLVSVFELENEVSLYDGIRKDGEAPYTEASLFDTACGNTMAAILRGMNRAVHDVGQQNGLKLRTILGATSDGSVGFLKLMDGKGVDFDIVGFHAYPYADQPLLTTDPWYGPGGAIGLLTSFNKPIHINEFHCGEIYEDGFTNVAGSASMNACLESLEKHLDALVSSGANIEVIDMYEMTDGGGHGCVTGDPFSGLAGDAECRFGIMYDLNTPKPGMDIIKRYRLP